MKKEDDGAAEQGDALAAAVARLNDEWQSSRAPGLLQFGFSNKSMSIIVTRSRFDGEYGSICRLQRTLADETKATTFAPTVSVCDAVRATDPKVAIEKLFNEWNAKG